MKQEHECELGSSLVDLQTGESNGVGTLCMGRYSVTNSCMQDPAKSRGISPDTQPTRPLAEFAKIRRYSTRLSRIIVLLFNTLITEKLEAIFFC